MIVKKSVNIYISLNNMRYIIKSIRILRLKKIILKSTIKKNQTDNVGKRKNEPAASFPKQKCPSIRR